MNDPGGERKTGSIDRILGEYGFVVCDDIPGLDIYFKVSWFNGVPPLRKGEAVSFQLRSRGEQKFTAHYLTKESTRAEDHGEPQPRSRLPMTDFLLSWAYLGHLPSTLSELRGLALREDWEFKNTVRNPNRPHPILRSYRLRTSRGLFSRKRLR